MTIILVKVYAPTVLNKNPMWAYVFPVPHSNSFGKLINCSISFETFPEDDVIVKDRHALQFKKFVVFTTV